MSRVVFFIIILVMVASCKLDGIEADFLPEVQEKVKGNIKLSGPGFSVKSSPLNARQTQQEVIAYRIEKLVGGEVQKYARGVAKNIENLELEFDPSADYKIMLSYVSLGEEVDLAQDPRIFDRRFSAGLQEFVDYYPYDLNSSLEIYPFHTAINTHFNGSYSNEKYPPSDKFVGEAEFRVGEDPAEIEIEMHRLSGSIGFRALNLQEGKVVIYVGEENRSAGNITVFTVELLPEEHEKADLRPAIHVRNDYRGDLIYDIINNRGSTIRRPRSREEASGTPLNTAFSVGIRYFEHEDETGNYRDIIFGDVRIIRNQAVIYQFDMEDYESPNSRILAPDKGLEAVDEMVLEDRN
ncbi:hypothetical protein [Litoribacter populi]|uniref:hypothetical protein n=1 Tax=Litoribacter populi TaxID=2598460 RepID=UPI00117FA76C|nr:hypothetical protein [Litoribacter populi]